MRIGVNPEKQNTQLEIDCYHRIIVPVYIPNFQGYFQDSLDILKLCLESLLLTIHEKTKITIYNNASHITVKNYIDKLYEEHDEIDQVFHSKNNLGKINAILAAAKGNLEPLITISDADVFFKHGWQSAVENVFLDFDEAGMVSPVPSSKAYKSFVNANWYYGFFKGKIRFDNVKDPKAMKLFDDSLGRDVPLYNKIHLERYLTLSNNKSKAAMGCGHFVATLRREVFDIGSNSPAFIKIVGGVENKFIDFPNEKLGFLRLATLNNYAYHLGNIKEDWMFDEFDSLKEKSQTTSANYLNIEQIITFKNFSKFKIFTGKLVSKILLSKRIKPIYFRLLGLEKGVDYS